VKHARLLIVAALAPALLPATAHAQDLSATDTTQILAAVLAEFRTPNGPIVRIVPDVPCAGDRGMPGVLPGGRHSCRSPATDAAVLKHAADRALELSSFEEPFPFCGWSGIEAEAANGVRLHLRPIRIVDDELRAGVVIRCRGYPGQPERQFIHDVEYGLARHDGGWRIVRVALQLIT
jgi:hypothetical protein